MGGGLYQDVKPWIKRFFISTPGKLSYKLVEVPLLYQMLEMIKNFTLKYCFTSQC